MSVTYRAKAIQSLDPSDVLDVYRRGGWRLLDRTYGKADGTKRRLATIVRHDGGFNPAAWLSAFASVGGWWAMTGDRLHLGWRVMPGDAPAAARMVYREVHDRPARLAAVRRHVEMRADVA